MSSSNFAPFQPSPDERQRVTAAAVNAPVASSSSSSSSSKGPSARQSSAPNSHAVSNGKLHDTLGRSDQSEDEYDDDPRYITDSYQSSTPRTPRSFGSGTEYAGGLSGAQPAWAAQQQQQQIASTAARPPQWRPQPPPQDTSFGAGFSTQNDRLSFSTSSPGWSLSNLCLAAWALPPFSSVLLLIYETENDLVRFHAYQSGMYGVGSIVVLYILRSWLGLYKISIISGMAALGYAWICGSNAANAAPTLARSPYLPILAPLAEQWVGEE